MKSNGGRNVSGNLHWRTIGREGHYSKSESMVHLPRQRRKPAFGHQRGPGVLAETPTEELCPPNTFGPEAYLLCLLSHLQPMVPSTSAMTHRTHRTLFPYCCSSLTLALLSIEPNQKRGGRVRGDTIGGNRPNRPSRPTGGRGSNLESGCGPLDRRGPLKSQTFSDALS